MEIYEETLTKLEDFLETIPSKNTRRSYKNEMKKMEEFLRWLECESYARTRENTT